MKRRELIKNSILGIGASALALSGCDKKEQTASSNNELNIIPKQTAQYEFSAPLPFNFKTIDEIAELNSTLKKSKVTSFYNNVPSPLASKFNSWVQVSRGDNDSIKSYDDFFKYVKHAKDNGIEFSYLMNSPKPFSQKDFETFKDDFLHLLDVLKKAGCKDIKVANAQVIELFNKYTKGEFNLHASTAFEFHTISQYQSLFNNYPDIKNLIITYDENKNFKLLKNLRTLYPNRKIEVMVNETCPKGCPARISHLSEIKFCKYDCNAAKLNYSTFCDYAKKTYIYPWELEYYSALGINNFKLTAQGIGEARNDVQNISIVRGYLNYVENNPDITVDEFFSQVILKYIGFNIDKKVMLSEIKDLFPDIRHFIKHGSECATKCRVECNYCFDCAKKLESKLLYS